MTVPEPGRARGVALGDELVVGGDDHAQGDAEVGGQGPARRHRRPGDQPARADGVAEPGLDLGPQAPGPGAVQLDETSAADELVRIRTTQPDLTQVQIRRMSRLS